MAFVGTLRLKLTYRHLVVVRKSVPGPGVFLCPSSAVLNHSSMALLCNCTKSSCQRLQGRHISKMEGLYIFGSSFCTLLSFLTNSPDQHIDRNTIISNNAAVAVKQRPCTASP